MRNIANLSLSGVIALILLTYSSQDGVHFQTDHRIGAGTEQGYTGQLMIPFGRYALHAFVAAIDPATNLSVYIAQFTVARSLGSFIVLSHGARTKELQYVSEDGRATSHTAARVLNAEIKRSLIAEAFVLSLALINWLLTIETVYITALIASGKMEANRAVVALPISMMFAVPGIRALYARPPTLSTSFGTFCLHQSTLRRFDPLHLQIRHAPSCNF